MAMLTGLGLAALGLLVVMAGEGGHGPGEAKPQESWWPWLVEVALGLLTGLGLAPARPHGGFYYVTDASRVTCA